MLGPIGVSVGSLLPWSIGPGASERVDRIINQAGLDGIQLLPLRGWKAYLQSFPAGDSRVMSFEDRWGHKAQDWFLFGGEEYSSDLYRSFLSAFPLALRASHHWGDDLVELHPEMGHTLTSPLELRDYPLRLLADLWHLRRAGRNGEPSIEESLGMSAEAIMYILALSGKLGMVHFQPRRDAKWDDVESQALQGMLAQLDVAPQPVPVIIETKPALLLGITSETDLIAYLSEVKRFILECAG